jgi:hypothetical protein
MGCAREGGGAHGPRARSCVAGDVRADAGPLLGRSLASSMLLGRSLACCADTSLPDLTSGR